MLTFDNKLAKANYKSSGFDYMRLVLAVSVLCVHSYEVCYGSLARDENLVVLRPLIALILPMFFALSGFLVAGSLERTGSLSKFLYMRVIRIFPALAVESVLSAVILGAIFTTLPLQQYFTHPDFIAYFANIIGIIHYQLPGVFRNNPVPDVVNAQLWTVPYELWCYILLSFLFLIKTKKPLEWIIVLVLLHLLAFANEPHPRLVSVNGTTLLLSFISGVVCYRFKSAIIYNPWLFIVALCLSLILLAFPKWDFLAALPCAYATVYLGAFNPNRKWVIESGDYSYGIFLYGYALQQAFATVLELRTYYLNLPLSLLATFLCAYLSWNYVEKPMLSLKKFIMPKRA